MSLEMYLGEVRDVEFTVTAQNNQPFTIRNPTYELTYGGNVEVAGVPEMGDNTLTVTVEPKNVGYYLLILRLEIAGEVIVSKQNLIVKE